MYEETVSICSSILCSVLPQLQCLLKRPVSQQNPNHHSPTFVLHSISLSLSLSRTRVCLLRFRSKTPNSITYDPPVSIGCRVRVRSMRSRGSHSRLAGSAVVRSPISSLTLAMFATMASVYVAGRLWLDAESRVYLIKELNRRTGQENSAISVDDTLKIIACREQQKKLTSIELELAAARDGGFVSKNMPTSIRTRSKRKNLIVIGIITSFGHRRNRDAIRKAWMPTDAALKKLESEKGIVVRFVIGKSANRGDSLDRDIATENRQTNDFLILDNYVEGPREHSEKMKLFFVHAAGRWEAEFYSKANDDIYLNVDALGATLASYLNKPRVYIGCMKSGEVFSDPTHKWYEPEWWKFGKKSYIRHASGEIFVISQALAQFLSINSPFLRTYAHDDVTAGSWFIGLDVQHIDEQRFCCSSWSAAAAAAKLLYYSLEDFSSQAISQDSTDSSTFSQHHQLQRF